MADYGEFLENLKGGNCRRVTRGFRYSGKSSTIHFLEFNIDHAPLITKLTLHLYVFN